MKKLEVHTPDGCTGHIAVGPDGKFQYGGDSEKMEALARHYAAHLDDESDEPAGPDAGEKVLDHIHKHVRGSRQWTHAVPDDGDPAEKPNKTEPVGFSEVWGSPGEFAAMLDDIVKKKPLTI